MAKNITLMGASYSNVPAVQLPQTGGGTARFDDASVTTATASDVASGKVFLAADGTITTGTNSGGGASNFVTGTFTTGSTSSANETVDVPYSGSGYPLMLVIYVEGGCYNSAVSGWYNSMTRYAVGQFCITKGNASTAPSYSTSGNANYGTVQLLFKNSTTSATSYSSTRSATANSYSSSNANGTSTTCVRWRSNTRISYRTAGGTSSTYGLLEDTTYRYVVLYSE